MRDRRERGRVIEAEGFVLRGPDGTARARLGVNPDGSVFFTLMDEDEVPRAELSISAEGTSLLVQAAGDRRGRVVSRVEADGRTGVFVYDANGAVLWAAPGPPEAG